MPLPQHYVKMIEGFKGRLPDLLTELKELRHGRTFHCPYHLLPTEHNAYHKDSTCSASLTEHDTNFFCHKCRCIGDVIDFVQLYYHVNWTTAVMYLNAKYNLGVRDLATPIANFDTGKYKPQYAKGTVVVEQPTVVQQPATPTTTAKKKDEKMWMPPVWKREYLDEKDRQRAINEYRENLIKEGTRIIKAGHGALAYSLKPNGKKVPKKLPEQLHGAAEPIRDVDTLQVVFNRLIKTEKDIETIFLGITLQNRILCLDVDTRDGKEGLLNLRRLEVALGEDLPLKTYDCSRSLGRHFFFRIPKGYDAIGQYDLPNRLGGLLPATGIEIITGVAGVVVPPSTGYIKFEGGFYRSWKYLRKLPPKWYQLLSQSGAEANELIRDKSEWFKTSNSKEAV